MGKRFQMVLTASINPNGMFVKVSDSKVREGQYLKAVAALLNNPSPLVDGVTFIENTGSDLSAFHKLASTGNRYGKKTEFIGLSLNDYPKERGIGYGEFRLLDAGIAQSTHLTAESYIVKLTGRLQVRNLASILGGLPDRVDMALDVHPHKDAADGEVDSRLMVIAQPFYVSRIAGMYHKINGYENITAEHCLYQIVRENPGAMIVPRLPREPQWVGFSGSTGMRYDSLWMRIKYPPKAAYRALSRMFNVPNLRQVWATAPAQTAQ